MINIRGQLINQLKKNIDDKILTIEEVKKIINSKKDEEIFKIFNQNLSSYLETTNKIDDLKNKLIEEYPELTTEIENARNCKTCLQDVNIVLENLNGYIQTNKSSGCKWLQFAACAVLATEAGPLYPLAGYLCYCSYCTDTYNICK